MPDTLTLERPKAPPPAPRPHPAHRRSPQMARRVKFMDRLAGQVIRFGGVLVILTVLAIFVFIGKEALPLFLPAKSQTLPPVATPAPAAQMVPGVLGMDETETYTWWLTPTGSVALAALQDWQPAPPLPIGELDGRTITAAYRTPAHDILLLGTPDGHVLVTQVKFRPVYAESGRTIKVSLGETVQAEVSPAGSAVTQVFGRRNEEGTVWLAARCADGTLHVGSLEEMGEPSFDTVDGLPKDAEVTALVVGGEGEKLFAATADGHLYHWYSMEDLAKPFAVIQTGAAGRHITAMEFLTGDNSLLLGFNDGSLEQWFAVREKEDQFLRPWKKIRSFDPLPGPVTQLVPSGRDRSFVAAAADGTAHLIFTTSERTLLTFEGGGPLRGLAYSPKLTSVLAFTEQDQARRWLVDNSHPEISLKTLFGKVWYEGYEKPDYVWQSTGGSDQFESKLSLVPLTLGTLKAAIYGLLFAIPIAVMAALYTSQFMSPRLKTVVKPAVEIMAALPSVVIGFLAGLWLAPLLETHVVSAVGMAVTIPLLVLGGVLGWNALPRPVRNRMPPLVELGLISVLVIGGFFLSIQLGPVLENWFFGGDLRQWVFNHTGHQFEQRNSIVIGFAMGFAVIPIIFTISEDALANVPQHFTSGSLALGASRWQTAARIILPTASPGIFSAIMVGFGRAVGETMIVLMATGNTPILSFSPFNGMRTLSANIAVEIPEAPVAGTLYRVLFLTAILLFILTFAVNTVAEVVRQRLREKYKAV